jgi:serine/threonine protein kinase
MPQTQKQQIGRYEILEEIGRGAMGVVFKGHDPLIGRLVAVKTITAGVAENPALLERFYREARAAGGLQHPNIVTIYELAESGDAPFIAMEYLEGESLEKIIARTPALPLATRLGYVLQTCRALDYAHRRGVIHRDVKPANIVVTRDGVVKVVDFGIARLASASQTQTGTLLGTLAYMSPEQLRGQNAGARSDIWALGVVLYELTAYQRPFTGENHGALLLSILQKEPPPIRQLLPECPVALEKVVLKSLRKNDKERYQSMEELLKDLENFNSSLPRGSQTVAQTAVLPRIAPQPSQPTIAIPRPAGTAPVAKPETRQLFASIAKPAQQNPHPGRKAVAAFATLAVIALVALTVLSRYNVSALPIPPHWAQYLHLPASASPAPSSPHASRDVTTNSQAPAPLSADGAQPSAQPARDAPANPVADIDAPAGSAPDGTSPPSPRSVVTAQPHDADLQNSARQEQEMWDKATAYLQDGDLDDADKSLRDVLALPAMGPRWSDAAHYVDQVIPERRRDQQLWTAALFASTSLAPGHLLQEVKLLDELLAAGGARQKEARQMRDTAIAQLVLGNTRRKASSPADGDQWQMARLKNHFDEVVQQGDAAALDQLQDLQSKFKLLTEGEEPNASDARDYVNSVIPKAQKHIEDSLVAAESDSSANAAYTDAVKQYSRALAAQNSATLRGQVLPLFTQIAQSGGPRAKEAQRYVDVLVPAALKASAQ